MESKNTKKCNGCEQAEHQHSIEWEMMKELAKKNQRLSITIIVLLGLWFSSVLGFICYIAQF